MGDLTVETQDSVVEKELFIVHNSRKNSHFKTSRFSEKSKGNSDSTIIKNNIFKRFLEHPEGPYGPPK